MTAELSTREDRARIEQIAEWLCARGWLSCPDGDPRGPLARVWVDVAERYGADSGPARGALLDIVREAWGDPHITARSHGDDENEPAWDVCRPLRFGSMVLVHGLCSEADALIAALESAP